MAPQESKWINQEYGTFHRTTDLVSSENQMALKKKGGGRS